MVGDDFRKRNIEHRTRNVQFSSFHVALLRVTPFLISAQQSNTQPNNDHEDNAFLTAGATFVPNNSIAFIVCAWGRVPTVS